MTDGMEDSLGTIEEELEQLDLSTGEARGGRGEVMDDLRQITATNHNNQGQGIWNNENLRPTFVWNSINRWCTGQY